MPVLNAHVAVRRRPSSARQDLTVSQRRGLVAGAVTLHVALGWGLLQVPAVREMVAEASPVFISMVADEARPAPQVPVPPVPPVPAPQSPAPVERQPVLASTSTAPAAMAVAERPIETPPAPAPVSAPAPATPAPAAAPVPMGPRTLPLSAVQYLVMPQLEYPRASRRQRESGRAQVRVLIDEAGQPRTVEIASSTGFPLLDQAAVAAVRKARFKPYQENGQAQAAYAVIPLTFDLEN